MDRVLRVVLATLCMVFLAESARAQTQSRYMLLPLYGVIGVDVSPEMLQQAMDAAKQQHADYVILLVDSQGGWIDSADAMIGVISRTESPKTVAFIKRAEGPVVGIAAACRKVFMYEGGKCESVVPTSIGGRPLTNNEMAARRQALSEVLVGGGRSGGRSELLMLGFVDPDLALWASDDVPPKIAAQSGSDGWTQIKAPGALLKLDSTSAVRVGFAESSAKTVEELGRKLFIDGPWVSAGEQGREILQQRHRQKEDLQQRMDLYKKSEADINRLQERMRLTGIQKAELNKQAAQMKADFDKQGKAIIEEFNRTQDESRRDEQAKQLEERFGRKFKELTQRMNDLTASENADAEVLKQYKEKIIPGAKNDAAGPK